MHRNQMRLPSGDLDWLTLPLKKAPQDVLIRDLEFRPTAEAELLQEITRFPALNILARETPSFFDLLAQPCGKPVDYIVNLLEAAAKIMGIPWNVVRSSDLALPAHLKAQDRILAIAEHFQASHYINPPGGRGLYQQDAFSERGMALSFLSDYQGPYDSIAQRLATEPSLKIAEEIRANMSLSLGI